MRTYRVLRLLSTQDGTHIYPGSIIGLLDEARATALVAAGAIEPAEPAADAAAAPAPAAYPTIVEGPAAE